MSDQDFTAPPTLQIPDAMRVSSRLRQLLSAGTDDSQATDIDAGADSRPTQSATSSRLSDLDRAVRASLRQFASQMIAAADQHGQTPILVCGRSVTLQTELYAAICDELVELAGRSMRLESLSPSLVGPRGFLLRRDHRRRLKQLMQSIPEAVEVVELSRISRPAGTARPLIIGMVSHPSLMPWIPTASCYRLLLLEAGFPTAVPADFQGAIQRVTLSAVEPPQADRNAA